LFGILGMHRGILMDLDRRQARSAQALARAKDLASSDTDMLQMSTSLLVAAKHLLAGRVWTAEAVTEWRRDGSEQAASGEA
jgi:hypothetical protein